MCWDKCVGGDPGKDLTDKQKNCIANCSGVPSSTTGSSSVASSADLPSPPACSSLSDPEMHVHCREIPGHVNVCGESHPTEAQRRQSPLILGRRRSAWVGFATPHVEDRGLRFHASIPPVCAVLIDLYDCVPFLVDEAEGRPSCVKMRDFRIRESSVNLCC